MQVHLNPWVSWRGSIWSATSRLEPSVDDHGALEAVLMRLALPKHDVILFIIPFCLVRMDHFGAVKVDA